MPIKKIDKHMASDSTWLYAITGAKTIKSKPTIIPNSLITIIPFHLCTNLNKKLVKFIFEPRSITLNLWRLSPFLCTALTIGYEYRNRTNVFARLNTSFDWGVKKAGECYTNRNTCDIIVMS